MSITLTRKDLTLIGYAAIGLIQGYSYLQRKHLSEISAVHQAWHDWSQETHEYGHPTFQAEQCECAPTSLEADILQTTAETWNWRIYDTGCNQVTREFAAGNSDSLADAQAHVLETMNHVAEVSEFELTQPDFMVMHHVCAVVR